MTQDDMLAALKLFIDYDNSLHNNSGASSIAIYDRAILLARSIVVAHETEALEAIRAQVAKEAQREQYEREAIETARSEPEDGYETGETK